MTEPRSSDGKGATWSLTKEMVWPCSRGCITSLLPSLNAKGFDLVLVTATSGHVALCFRQENENTIDLVVVVDAVPEQKFDQPFQLDIIGELRKDTTENFLAANVDMILCRHSVEIKHIAFLKEASVKASKQSAQTLRCVVVRSDGSAYVWEWSAEKFAWTYLNFFSFAENSSRILLSTTFPSFGGHHGLAWWSGNALSYRHVAFEIAPSLAKHPTHIVVGNLVTISNSDPILFMCGSKLGLWFVTEKLVSLQNEKSPSTLTALNSSTPQKFCIHDLTGALITASSTELCLFSKHQGHLHKKLLPYNLRQIDVEIAGHRQFLLVASKHECTIFDIHSGGLVTKLTLPIASYRFWSNSSATGIWANQSFYRLKVPSAVHYAEDLGNTSLSQKKAYQHLKNYGSSLKFQQAVYAYSRLRALVETSGDRNVQSSDEWRSLEQIIENPGLLLSLLTDDKPPQTFVQGLENQLASIQARYHAILSIQNEVSQPLCHTTPLNLDTFDYIHRWVQLNEKRSKVLSCTKITPRLSKNVSCSIEGNLSNLNDMSQYLSTPLAVSRKLHSLSPLQLMSWACSSQFGQSLLSQLELYLLENVKFRESSTLGVPSHLLFHEERSLSDFRMQKHLYFECMARMYCQHEPKALAPFIACITQHCPRLFSLQGYHHIPKRTHSERALLALTPLALVDNLSADNVDAYAKILCQSDAHIEAATILLRYNHFESCVTVFKAAPNDVKPILYWKLLDYSVVNPDTVPIGSLFELIKQKPSIIASTQVLQALKHYLKEGRSSLTMGQLRPSLVWLLKQKN
ncbi:hypothetical protein THRCLA_05143 [Thraustotheca clavata]|uniref:Uncharacterized protein n=1 Tax=Thraustotheca clavata TaxID=74557 RepID=A0A1V9ZWT9_9STRA|nr:hypothetical protein THRCLA_05143 [Thraustotheca clavata]